MAKISEPWLLLLMIGLSPSEGERDSGISGITRLQKLVFLLQEEESIRPTEGGFQYEAYKAGPYSSKLYDDLELLENLGLIECEIVGETTFADTVDIEILSFEDLMGDGGEKGADGVSDGLGGADAFSERRYRLTRKGRKKLEDLASTGDYAPIEDGVRRIKSKYCHYSLTDLLRYVYEKYPGMTIESEIKDQVLGR